MNPVRVYDGLITFYPPSAHSKGRFQAICPFREQHGEGCQLTRASHGSEGGTRGRDAQGRPLGLMAAWLASAVMFETKADHQGFAAFIGAEDRAASRAHLLNQVGGADLAANERPRREGEPEEPTDLA